MNIKKNILLLKKKRKTKYKKTFISDVSKGKCDYQFEMKLLEFIPFSKIIVVVPLL